MNGELIKKVVEAALMVAEKPLNDDRLLSLFDPAEQSGLPEAISQALDELRSDYDGRGIELKKVASGYRIQARAELAPWINRLWEEKPPRYSRAFMETLSIIAYRQPITRGEIEDIRGVAVSSHIIRTLMDRDWLRVAGHRDVPGRPAVYVTTQQFLDYFGLTSLADLPALPESDESEQQTLEENQAVAVLSPDVIEAVEQSSLASSTLEHAEPLCARVEGDFDGAGVLVEAAAFDSDAAEHVAGGAFVNRSEEQAAALSVADLETLTADDVAEQVSLVEAMLDEVDSEMPENDLPAARSAGGK